MKIYLTTIFIMIFGITLSQKSFYASIDLLTKMSFNSTHPITWDTKNPNVSPLFEYNHASYTLADPFRLGVSLGWHINPKHALEIGVHYDGVTSKYNFRFSNYQEVVDYNTANVIKGQSRSDQKRYYINYKYALKNEVDKTNLSIFGSLSLVSRAGPKGIGSVGGFGGSGILVKDSINFDQSSINYTSYSNRALQVGLGLSSDIYISKKYWFTLSFQYSHSSKYLAFAKQSFSLIYINSGDVYKYEFRQHKRAAGLYFGVSRHFYLEDIFKKNKDK